MTKKVFNLFLAASMLCVAMFQFSPKVAAEKAPHGILTPRGRIILFLNNFNKLAHTYTYDANFADEQQSRIEWLGKDDLETLCNLQEHSLDILDKYHRGVCRNFAFAVERELNTLKIKNWLAIDKKQNHLFNIYLNPIDGKPMVADLTRQIDYNEDLPYIVSQLINLSDGVASYVCQKGLEVTADRISNMALYGHFNLRYFVEKVLREYDEMVDTMPGFVKNEKKETMVRLCANLDDSQQIREMFERDFEMDEYLEELFPRTREEEIIVIDPSYDSTMTLEEFEEKINFDRYYKNYELEKSFY